MREIMEKVLEEVDVDIKEFMLRDSSSVNTSMTLREGKHIFHKNWELIDEPNLFILK